MKELKRLVIMIGDSLIGHDNIYSFVPEYTGSYAYKLMKKLQTKGDVHLMVMGWGGTAMSHNHPSPAYSQGNWIYQKAVNIHQFNTLGKDYEDKYQVKITPDTKIATVFQYGTNDLGCWNICKPYFVNDYLGQLFRFNDGKHFVGLIPSLWSSDAHLQNEVNDHVKQVINQDGATLIDHRNVDNQALFNDMYHPNPLGNDIMANNAYKAVKPYLFGGAQPIPDPVPDSNELAISYLNTASTYIDKARKELE